MTVTHPQRVGYELAWIAASNADGARCLAPPGPVNATRSSRPECYLMLPLPPLRHPRHDNAKNGGGMWPQCGATRGPVRISASPLSPFSLPHTKHTLRPPAQRFCRRGVDIGRGGSLYKPLRRAAARRDGMSAKPLTEHSVNPSGQHVAKNTWRRMYHVGCAGFGGLPLPCLPCSRGRQGRRKRTPNGPVLFDR